MISKRRSVLLYQSATKRCYSLEKIIWDNRCSLNIVLCRIMEFHCALFALSLALRLPFSCLTVFCQLFIDCLTFLDRWQQQTSIILWIFFVALYFSQMVSLGIYFSDQTGDMKVRVCFFSQHFNSLLEK